MDEAMKYRIKNKKLAEFVYSVFDEEDVQRTIAEQIDDDSANVLFCSNKDTSCYTKLSHEREYLKNNSGKVSIFVKKDTIEKIGKYEPLNWNHYPETKPPKNGKYLIQLKDDNETFFAIGNWEEENPWRGEFVFREFPEPYLEEEIKEEAKEEEVW